VESVKLAEMIIKICRLGAFNEWTHPLIIEVYWQDTLGGVLLCWTHVDVQKSVSTQVFFKCDFSLFLFFSSLCRLTRPFEHVDAECM
jgi:hypothetical protein